MRLFGWTLTQWAVVLKTKPTSLEEALKIKQTWRCTWKCDPAEKPVILGIERNLNYEAAVELFELGSW